jgi:hypothetical protein
LFCGGRDIVIVGMATVGFDVGFAGIALFPLA